MDFRQLETFVAIAKLKSFSKAADCLFLSQPTISSHISNLEKELNTTLINRTNKKISLTKAGEILFQHAVNILNIREEAKYKLDEFNGKIVGNIEIASSTIPEQYIIPELICEFNKLYPDVSFNLLHYDSQQVVDGIIRGEIDFGIVGAKISHNHLKYIELLNDELLFITQYDPELHQGNAEISLKNILKKNFIFRERGSGTRSLFENALNENNIDINSLNIVAYVENTEAIKQCVRRGLGVSFLSKRAVEDEVKFNLLTALKIKELSLRRKFYFVYHKFRSPSPLEAEFHKFVCNYFQDK